MYKTLYRYFLKYFSSPRIPESVESFITAIIPHLKNWNIDSQQLLLETLKQQVQPVTIHVQCVIILKRYVNSRDFSGDGRYKRSKYFGEAIHLVHETKLFKKWNKNIDSYILTLSKEERQTTSISWLPQLIIRQVITSASAAQKLSAYTWAQVELPLN